MRELYHLGAVRVTAVEISGHVQRARHQDTPALIVELPGDTTRRANLFAWQAEFARKLDWNPTLMTARITSLFGVIDLLRLWWLLLVGRLFGGDGLLFTLRRAADLGLLLIGFLLIRFRGFIAHNKDNVIRVDFPAACQFLHRRVHHVLRKSHCK